MAVLMDVTDLAAEDTPHIHARGCQIGRMAGIPIEWAGAGYYARTDADTVVGFVWVRISEELYGEYQKTRHLTTYWDAAGIFQATRWTAVPAGCFPRCEDFDAHQAYYRSIYGDD